MHAYNIFRDIESTVHGIMQNARWKIVPSLHSLAIYAKGDRWIDRFRERINVGSIVCGKKKSRRIKIRSLVKYGRCGGAWNNKRTKWLNEVPITCPRMNISSVILINNSLYVLFDRLPLLIDTVENKIDMIEIDRIANFFISYNQQTYTYNSVVLPNPDHVPINCFRYYTNLTRSIILSWSIILNILRNISYHKIISISRIKKSWYSIIIY